MGDDLEYEEATPEEKLRIATYFISNSPNGEVDDVVRDVRKLVGSDNVLSRANLEAILRSYNCNQMVFAASPAGHNVMCCATAQLQPDVMFDPRAKQILTFDNFTRTWSAGPKLSLPQAPAAVEKYRVAIERAMGVYTDAVYLDPAKHAYAVFAAADGTITIHISAKNINLPNFWSGGWRTTFVVNVSNEGRALIRGTIMIDVHYFEDGNVQLDSDFVREEYIKIEDPESTAQHVHAAVDTIETQFQTRLEEFYVDMHKYTFTAMRRFLPVTRSPMDWNPNAHRLASQLKE